ncbi:MAG TPA: helix-turn-helix domain-containing protein [Acidimicrobiia bacterium]|nr:helix-turn-helix domain-containing protein [Acidimicrobiia bacterium]
MDEDPGALNRALERIGDRWSLLIIDALQEAPLRFSDLADRVTGIAPNILSSRLSRLEEEGVILSSPYSKKPLRHAYELTGAGRDLAGVLRLLAHWGDRQSDEGEAIRHELCGTPLEAHWYCASCDRMVDQGAETDIRLV